jgi:protein CpxP
MAVVFAAAVAKSQSADTEAAAMHHQEFGFGGHRMGFFADYLNLSDAQQTQMKAVMVKEHATLKPLMQQLHQAHQQLRQYEEGAYDEARVRAVAAHESQTLTELTVQKTRIHSELFQMLTPDQQAKMKEFEARHEARIEKRMGQAPSGPPEE